jgi:hypothetical protein
MKEASVPVGVLLVDTITGEPANPPVTYTFARYAVAHWLGDKRFVTPFTNLDIMIRLKKEFLKPEGSRMELEDGDLGFLAEIVKNPSSERENPLVQEQVRHFDQLILDLASAGKVSGKKK